MKSFSTLSTLRLFPLSALLLFIFLTACTAPASTGVPTRSLTQPPTSSPTASPPPPSPTLTHTPSRTPTTTPPATRTPAPTATPWPLPETLATAASIEFAGWSPDSRWVAFWAFTQETIDNLPQNDGGPYDMPGALHFYHLASGEMCEYPQIVSFRHPVFAWQDDGCAAVLGDDGVVRVGMPCGDEFASLSELEGLIALGDPSLSPGHTYRAEAIERGYDEETGILSYVTIITEAATGQERSRVAWDIRLELGWFYQTHWVTDDLLLIPETSDRGPLLVTVDGEVTEVVPELFAIGTCSGPLCVTSLHAVVWSEPETDIFHLVLYSWSEAPQSVRLYHSETQEVETLPFVYLWYQDTFSPAGKWLMFLDYNDTSYISSTTWVRAVDPLGSEAIALEDNVRGVAWSPEEGRVAFSTEGGTLWVQTFPEGEPLANWDLNPTQADDVGGGPVGWSPDGTQIAIIIRGYEIVEGTARYHSALHILTP